MCRYESHVTGVYLIGLDTDAFHSPHVAMMPIVPELLPELAWFAYLDIEKKLSSG